LKLRSFVGELLREVRPDFSWTRRVNRRRELLSGITGAVLVIPQAITFAYLVGLPPEFGLYCAIFVGFFSSFFGNTPMVGGPNTAMSILIALTIMPYSPAAISGIKMGVGVLLITSAVEGTLGLAPLTTQFFYEKFYIAIVSWNEIVNPYAATIGAVTVVSGLLMRKRFRRTYIIGAVLIGGTTGALMEGFLGPVRTEIELLGRVQLQLLPLRMPTVSAEYLLVIQEILPSAIAIAVLGLAQSLVIAQDLKNHVHNNVSLGKEVFAQAAANIASPFFSAFAGSGSFNRTSVAVSMGSKTPLSGLIAAGGVVVIAYSLGSVLTYLPMAAIAGVLALVGIGMIQLEDFRRFLRSRIDGAVLIITSFTVIFIGLEAGLVIAVLLSLGFFIAAVSKVGLAIVEEDGVERIQVRGNLFYASLDSLAHHLREHPGARTMLDLTRVPYCDSSAMALIEMIKRERLHNGGSLEVITA
jgi:SulP family sulfate permease